MGIVEKDRMCCSHCIYWHGCLVIAKNTETSFACSVNYCKFFERDDKPTFKDKMRRNNWKIPKLITP
jgi:hypothetical protein